MKEHFNTWVSGQGPPQLFIYYQKAYKFNDQGEIEDNYRNQQNEFFVTNGKSTIYFTLAASQPRSHQLIKFERFWTN